MEDNKNYVTKEEFNRVIKELSTILVHRTHKRERPNYDGVDYQMMVSMELDINRRMREDISDAINSIIEELKL